MKTIILSIFGYLLLSNAAVALTIVNMVNEGEKELHAFSVCPAANTIPAATCDEAHLRECKLLDYVDAVGADRKDQKLLQYQYLMYLIRKYRDRGLKEKEAEARARIDAIGFPKPEPQQPIDHLQYLVWADQQSEHCLPEHAKATVAQVERAEALKPAGWFEVPARIALSRARLGDRQGALDLIDSLKREFAAPPEAQRKWLRHYLVDRIIVTAAAELGEYDVADRYVASRGYDGDPRGLIAQIAVRRGDLDGADRLLNSGDVNLQLGQGWGHAMAYLALTHSYVLRGDFNSAVRVAERWNSRLAKEGDDVVKSLPRILPHRLIALEMAKRDPIAAMKYVRAHDPAEAPVCSSSLANVGARAGFAEEALQILASNELQPRPVNRGKPSRPWGEDEQMWELRRPMSPDELWVATASVRIAALVENAIAYRAKGNNEQANVVFEMAFSLAEAAHSESDYSITETIARFSPQRALIYSRSETAEPLLYQSIFMSSLLQRGKIAEAIAFHDGLIKKSGPTSDLFAEIVNREFENNPLHYRQIHVLKGIANHQDFGDCSLVAWQ